MEPDAFERWLANPTTPERNTYLGRAPGVSLPKGEKTTVKPRSYASACDTEVKGLPRIGISLFKKVSAMRTFLYCCLILTLSPMGFCQEGVNPPIDPRTNMQGFPASPLAYEQPSLKALMAEQQKLWQARKTGDAKAAKKILGGKTSIMSYTGAKDGRELIAQIEAGTCKVNSFKLTNFTLKYTNTTAGVLIYQASQDAACGAKHLPEAIRVRAGYWNVDGKWVMSFYVEERPK